MSVVSWTGKSLCSMKKIGSVPEKIEFLIENQKRMRSLHSFMVLLVLEGAHSCKTFGIHCPEQLSTAN